MPLETAPGPQIAALYFSAGFAAFGALVSVFVAALRVPIRALWWLAAMCLAAAGLQMSLASYHLATDLAGVALPQRWHNMFSIVALFSLTGFICTHTRQPHTRQVLLVMGLLCAGLLAMTLTMPLGTRFAGRFGLELMVFPWGERLQVLRGELSPASVIGRLTFLLPFVWLLVRAVVPYYRHDRLGALTMGIGVGVLSISVIATALIEIGRLDTILFGGFGYIAFAGLAAILVVREVTASNTRLAETAAALQQELDSHLQTRQVVEHLSYNDTLTDLPSRAGLFERLREPLDVARQKAQPLALLHVDIDRFDLVNDTLGPQVGDRLLRVVARRLLEALEPGEFVARMNADEFVCVLRTGRTPTEAAELAERLHAALRLPLQIDDHALHITVSVGIACYPADGDSAEALLTASDLATREAKRHGGNRTQVFRRELDEAIQERLHIGNALRVALERRQFELYFQPQIRSRDEAVISVEALIRWRHPAEGLIGPVRFIPVAEEMHLINAIGAWVIDESCRQLAAWRREGIADVRVAVNLSAQQLLQADLPEMVDACLRRHGLTGRDLELEITESMVMKDPDLSIARLNALNRMGISIAMDDFGTGYSSLSYLQRLPIDTLKIDRSFVKDLEVNRNDAAICATTIRMASTLGMETVAEGVETEAQAQLLRRLHCERFQGYFYARPMPATEVAGFVRQFNARRVAPPVA